MSSYSSDTQTEKFYGLFIDLQFGKPLHELIKAQNEAEFDELLKTMIKPEKWIHDVGIQEADGTITIITFAQLKNRYFNIPENN
jgi:hypothetical protein